MNTVRQGSRIAYLDGIRGSAILLVLGVHWVHPYTGLLPGGYVGVDVFFVLSGFVITTLIWRRTGSGTVLRTYGDFLRHRVLRLYPALIALVVVGVIAANLLGAPATGEDTVFQALITLGQGSSFVQALDLSDMSLFGQTWSLSAEWVFYLLWPLALLLLQRAGVRAGSVLIGVLVAAAVLYIATLPASGAWFYYGPTSRCCQLLLGGAVAMAMVRRSECAPEPSRAVWTTASVIAVIALVVWTVAGPDPEQPLYRIAGFPIATAATVILIFAGRAAPRGVVIAVLGSAPLAGLGLVSYSLYLWHLLPMQVLTQQIHIPCPVLGVISLLVVLLASIASYLLLEKPFQGRRSRQLIGQTAGGS